MIRKIQVTTNQTSGERLNRDHLVLQQSVGKDFNWRRFIMLLLLPFWVGCSLIRPQVEKEKLATAHYKFGVAYLRDSPPSIQKAYIEFQKAISIDPRHRDAHYALGHVHYKKEEYSKAVTLFKKTLSIDPGFSEAHNYLGKVYELQGKTEEAIIVYQKALENKLYATPQLPHLNLGGIYLKREMHREAEREFQDVLRIEPQNVFAHNGLGKAYHMMGKPKEAIASYQKAIMIAPAYFDAHFNLAFSYLKEGSKVLAAKEFREVMRLSPRSDQAEEAGKFLEALE